MTNKSMTIRRIIIFLLFAFVPPFIIISFYISANGWTIDNQWYGVLASAIMLFPALANVLSRLLTKEGGKDLLLSMKLRGNRKYLLFAMIVPVLAGITAAVSTALFILPSGALVEMFKNMSSADFITGVLNLLATSVIMILFGFGEEFGWRGYLTPKLSSLMPEWAAVIVSGIIWGLWHAPIIACGHNYGTDYPSYPWGGIGIMCLFCVAAGFFLTSLTKASGSVVPASLAHITINTASSGIASSMLSEVSIRNLNSMYSFQFSMIFTASVLFYVILGGIIISVINNSTKK